MNDRTCTETDCHTQHYALDLCKRHYKRNAKRRATLTQERSKLRGVPAEAVIRLRSIPDEAGCWIWQGATDAKGYGKVQFQLAQYLAHRLSYAVAFGPIPDDLTIDHRCRNTSCVNPEHLEAVTLLENIRRAWAARAAA